MMPICTPPPIGLLRRTHSVLFRPQMLLKELNLGLHKYEFSSLALSLSLEGKASHRELTSRLLSDLTGKLLSQSDMSRAFDKMLKELPDLILDTPEAPQVEAQSVRASVTNYVHSGLDVPQMRFGSKHLFSFSSFRC